MKHSSNCSNEEYKKWSKKYLNKHCKQVEICDDYIDDIMKI